MPDPTVTMRVRALPAHGTLFSTLKTEWRPGGNPNWRTEQLSYTRNNMTGTQVTESEGHPWRTRKRGANKDIGGDFFTQKKYVDGPIKKYRVAANWTGDGYYRTDTVISANPLPATMFVPSSTTVESGKTVYNFSLPLSAFPPPMISTLDELNSLGATAISRCKPTNSVADLSVAIGELAKDGLPKIAGHALWKDQISSARNRRKLAKNSADEYLNYQFGIKPILKDIQDFRKGILDIDDIYHQFEDAAGSDIRRRYFFPKEEKITEENLGSSLLPGLRISAGTGNSSPLSSLGTVVRRRRVVKRRWFSGCFTYTLPAGMSSRSKLGEIRLKADRLGVDPDLDTLYNVAPWSWAIDWFVNLGDVISNVNDFQKYGMIMRYGYLMEHVSVQDTYTRIDCRLSDGKPLRLPSVTLVTETKRRVKANPFGFGVKWSGLSPLQLSIAAALGISKGSKA